MRQLVPVSEARARDSVAHSVRIALFLWLLLAVLGCPSTGHASGVDDYPDRPITLVVGFAPGGESDRLARLLADRLRQALHEPVIVQNRSGAGGTIAAQYVARARSDGYTVLLGSIGSLAVAPLLNEHLGYDPSTDLVSISLGAMLDHVLVVHRSVPAHSLAEFIAFVKANPGRVTYASTGIGSASHLAAILFARDAGLDMVHVPYHSAGAVARDLLAGDVLAAFTPTTALQHVRAGQLRALASTGVARIPAMPALPTVAESGFPGYRVQDWYALMAPAGTPEKIVAALSAEVGRALRDPAIRASLAQSGMHAAPTSPVEAASFIAAERARWAALLQAVKPNSS